MSIDPRMMKQLLELQLLRKLDLLSPRDSAASSEGLGGGFADVLQTLMGQAGGITGVAGGRIIPAAQLLASSRLAFSPHPEALSAGRSSDYDGYIQEASARHGVKPNLVKAVIHAESSFNPYAVSKAGAKGLMQLMDSTGQGLGVSNPFDPKQNIQGGTWFLSNLINKYNGNVKTALAAYNAGPGRVSSLGITNDAQLEAKFSQLPRETQAYVKKVMDLQQGYAV